MVDAKTHKTIPAAFLMANRKDAPAFAKNTKTGGDGAFQIQGLVPGSYALCVQTTGEVYLDPCQWNGNPATVTLRSGESASGILVRVAQASLMVVQVRDVQNVLSQTTRDGRRPDLNVGVWGPGGLYYPARRSASSAPGSLAGATASYSFRLGVPRDTALRLEVTSRDVKLGDAAGTVLSGNRSTQPFQHATAEANPRSFAFTVLSLLP